MDKRYIFVLGRHALGLLAWNFPETEPFTGGATSCRRKPAGKYLRQQNTKLRENIGRPGGISCTQ